MPRLSKIGAAALAAFGWTTGAAAVTADFLVVAGGGGGGTDNVAGLQGGGGGAGGFLSGTASLNPTQSYTVTVGAGGSGGSSGGSGSNASNSLITGIATAIGGGGGGSYLSNAGGSGGSGGGGAPTPAGTGTVGQGNNGGTGTVSPNGGGGGGGAGAVGGSTTTPNGGVGLANPITGSTVGQLDSGTYYLAGGGGGRNGSSPNNSGTGGLGGGGTFGGSGAGTANTGGGAGGTGGGTAGSGGSGVVIISYVGAQQFGGGVVTSSGGNTIHTFTTSGTLSPLSSLTANFLVIAGGGAGGNGSSAGSYGAGGGGAGGYRTSVTGQSSGGGGSAEASLTIDTNSIYLVTVGAGGASGGSDNGYGNNGNDSAFLSITSVAGGGGGGVYFGGSQTNGRNGGSGGGGGNTYAGTGVAGGSGTTNQGFAGGTGDTVQVTGAGGGGAGGIGGNAQPAVSGGTGGIGVSSNITGSAVSRAGGGGGGYAGSPGGTATSGGGAGGSNSSGVDGTANTGGGGGGTGGGSGLRGGNGGSGIVIISYPGSTQQMAGGTVTVAGGNVIHTFTSSGYLTPIVLVTKSLRFRSSASAYLNRTFGTPTLSTKWTWSGWLKFGYGSSYYTIFDGGSPDTRFGRDPSTNQLYVNNDTTNYIITTPVYRDYSAWYHAVLAFDSSQGTASNRLRLYINGSEVTAFATDNRSSISGAIGINTATAHGIGRQPSGGSAYFDGYMTEINFIDGEALTPSSFGTFNGLGVWQPIRYGGSYGTNGFYLPFTDTTSTSTLGTDFSGNSNTWTVNGISLTSGATYDSMTDVPTLTSATTANYCVLNSLNQNSAITLSAGNLSFTASNNRFTTGTFAVTSGKWYWEFYPVAGGASGVGVGAILATTYVFGTAGFANGAGYTGVGYTSNGSKYISGTSSAYGATYGSGNVIGVALDLDSGTKTITFYKDNTSQGSINLPTSSEAWIVATDYSEAGTHSINFGQRPFTYTPPTGFKSLNTFNLPTPTIGATASSQANDYFDVVTYTGAGGTQTISGLQFQPDFIWGKARSASYSHALFDSVRGYGSAKGLLSNSTAAEGVVSAQYGYVSTNTSTGFTAAAGTDGSNPNAALNESGVTYVAWNWKANGSGSSNTQGSITSTVSANTTAGFSIVTYTGTGSNATVGHGLGVAPSMIIIKNRPSTGDMWAVWHTSFGGASNTDYLSLNGTGAKGWAGALALWNGTLPTSTVFSVGTYSASNESTKAMVAYCFAQIAGYSAFGLYTGNGVSDGPFIYTGFRPRFVMIKASGTTGAWSMTDTSRDPYNLTINKIEANTALSEASNAGLYQFDILSNGFKIRQGTGYGINNSADYIYMAFAESPFKYANAR